MHFHQISKNLPPPWVGKFAWCCRPVLCVGRQSMKNCSLTTLPKLVFVSTSSHLLSRTLNSHLVSRENPDIAMFCAVTNGNRITTEDKQYLVNGHFKYYAFSSQKPVYASRCQTTSDNRYVQTFEIITATLPPRRGVEVTIATVALQRGPCRLQASSVKIASTFKRLVIVRSDFIFFWN